MADTAATQSTAASDAAGDVPSKTAPTEETGGETGKPRTVPTGGTQSPLFAEAAAGGPGDAGAEDKPASDAGEADAGSPFDAALKAFEETAAGASSTTQVDANPHVLDEGAVAAIVERLLADKTAEGKSLAAKAVDASDEVADEADPVIGYIEKNLLPRVSDLQRRLDDFEKQSKSAAEAAQRSDDEQAIVRYVQQQAAKITMLPEPTVRAIIYGATREALRAYRAGEATKPGPVRAVVNEAIRERIEARKEASEQARAKLAAVREESRRHTVTTANAGNTGEKVETMREMAKRRFGTDRLTLDQFWQIENDGSA